ncbi:hypothetical protein ACFQPF_05485 [Fictibacillus iocasae]|uniref:Peptidase M48 domain-containing protein n=1 Tax=Fictibacillus iocasae TaxID=2715437 RepID=A0ABW2NPE3_9BACL
MRINPQYINQMCHMAEKLQMTQQVKLKTEKNRVPGARASGNTIYLRSGLLQNETLPPAAITFVIAHELIHIHYRETGWNRAKQNLLSFCGNKKASALILLSELRANIEGRKLANLTPDEVENSLTLMYAEGNNGNDDNE